MTAWSDPFCDALAAGGYQVVRFDNRDVGLSSKIEGGRPVNMKWAFLKLGLKVQGPYSLGRLNPHKVKTDPQPACRDR
jgi:pimeloyl-ACP methyl ester carboxylesterase